MKKVYLVFFLILSIFLVSCDDDLGTDLSISYDLTFMLDDTEVYKVIPVQIGDDINLPENPVKADHVFEGWYINGEEFKGDKVTADALTLYARFRSTLIQTQIVKFYNGAEFIKEVTIEKGQTLGSLVPTLTKEDHTLDGWYTSADFKTKFVITNSVQTDLNLYAKWTKNDEPIELGDLTGYYAGLNGLQGEQFNTQLRSLIQKTGTATGSTAQVKSADVYNGGYYLIYDGQENYYGNREHVWPNSKLGSAPDYDLHNLRAADTTTNSKRSNYPFTTGSGNWALKSSAFYPGDEHVGDVARIVLYIHVRYNLNITLVGNLNMFLQWHQQDPVNDFERVRNDRIQGIQNNRNPFIDHPEFVTALFGSAKTSFDVPSVPSFTLI